MRRRDVMFLMGSAAVGALRCGSGEESPTGSSSPVTGGACVVRPALTEGPYFVDERLNRSDIRADVDGAQSPGVPLRLGFAVTRARDCAPLENVMVDVWHCDALGTYSDVQDPGGSTLGHRYLRGFQLTNAAGEAQFLTVFPGWYSGRAVHVHFKLRNGPGAAQGFEFTSQIFFDESLIDAVHAQPPYNAKGRRNTSNASDGIFQGGGSQLLLPTAAEAEGYAGRLELALQV